MTKQPDLTYTDNGVWVNFYPETDAGRAAWDVMLNHDQSTGTGATFLTIWKKEILSQLRRAGYSVHKVKSKKATDAELQALVDALAA